MCAAEAAGLWSVGFTRVEYKEDELSREMKITSRENQVLKEVPVVAMMSARSPVYCMRSFLTYWF